MPSFAGSSTFPTPRYSSLWAHGSLGKSWVEDDTAYRVRIEAVWDIARKKDVRVVVSVDDGGWRALRPLSQGFVIRPDGSFTN